MKSKMKSGKMLNKANALKGFMNSMSMKKGQEGFIKKDSKEPISFNYKAKYRGDKQIVKGTSPEGNYKTKRVSEFMSPDIEGRYLGPSTVKETARRTMKGVLKGAEKPVKPSMKKGGSFPDLNKDGQITKADILMGRGVINKPKAQKGMNVKKEAMKNATPSIPNSYYAMGGMKEENPLASMIKKKSNKKAGMKPKMQMGGAFFPQNPLTASKYQKDTLMGQSFKKGGKVKKK